MSIENAQSDELEADLALLKQAIKSDPGNAQHRIAYFQWLCVLGDWERAGDQLKIVSDVEPASALFAQVYSRALRCEIERKQVFAGEADPSVIGEPSEWVAHMIGALRHSHRGEWEAAARAQAVAFEAAPAISGTLNGKAIEWVADADSRLGPMLEAFVEGHYCWVPFERIARLTVTAPTHLIDRVWIGAKFDWTNRGTTEGWIPVRYSGSDSSDSVAIRKGALTQWKERAANFHTGLGQRMISTDSDEIGLLDLRELLLGTPVIDGEENAESGR